MKHLVSVSVLALIGVLALAAKPPQQAATARPSWAFAVPDPSQPPAEDPNTPKHLPGSSKTYTPKQIDDLMNPPDWFPDSHPAAPTVVTKGHDDVMACGSCHLMSGEGHPESATLTGLSEGYIEANMADFKTGARKDPARMNGIAKGMTDDEINAAAKYFAALKPVAWVKVQEADTVPKTYVTPSRMRLPLPAGGTEPIGNRIIVVPQDPERDMERDPTSGFIAYVPTGSLAKGKDLVENGGGGKTLQCAICHGDGLKGMGDVPRIAGLFPTYIARQLYYLQGGESAGAASAMMTPVVGRITDDDILNIAAYVASLPPN